jgi:serine/threonine protein kinase
MYTIQGNVLISEGRAMLADFGLAVVGDGASSDPPAAGASRWLAPELIKNGVYLPLKTKQADIFAFGRLCLAVCHTFVPLLSRMPKLID